MKKLISLILSLLLAPSIAVAAVTFDSASSAACTACTSLSWNHTVTAGTNRLLIVGSGIDQFFSGLGTITNVTYNSVSLNAKDTDSHDFRYLLLSYLVAPDAGTHAIEITANELADLGGGGISYTGVDQVTPLGTATHSDGSNDLPTGLSATVPTDGMAQDIAYAQAPGGPEVLVASAAGQTQQYNNNDNNNAYAGSTRSTSGNFQWTGQTGYSYHVAVPINPAAAATPMVRRRPILQ